MISFIIIGYNEGWKLTKSLQSVFETISYNGLKNAEVIYVDSKSSDDSIGRAKIFRDIKICQIIGDTNAAIARNIGALEAKGDIYFFIDGDMEISKDCISQILNENQQLIYPFLSGIFDDIIYDNNGYYIKTTRRHKLKEGMPDKFEMTTGGLFVINASLWREVGGMDTRFNRSQDLDFGLRLASKRMPLCRKSIFMAKHHTTSYYSRQSAITMVKYSALLWRKHITNKYYYSILFKSHYTFIALILSFFIAILGYPMIWLFYLLSIIYKTYSAHIKDRKINVFRLFLQFILKDFYFIFLFIFFNPQQKAIQYIIIKDS
jgi:glycosyltransferase involved in cell wall biosynthesis